MLLLTTVGSVNAQDYFSFYNLGDYVAQTQNVSPVYLPKNSFTFGTPANVGAFVDAGFKINQVLVEGSVQGTNKIDFNELLKTVEPENNFAEDINASVFMLAFKTKKGSFSVFANSRVTTDWQYSDDFIGIAANGIESFDLSQDRIQSTAFHEIGIGITRTFFKEKLAIGIRAKYLNGVAHASTEDGASATLDINPLTSQWTVTAQNATLNTAGIALEDGEEQAIFTGNTGFGFDFGAVYNITPKLSIELAVNDIGSINWKEQVVNYNIEDQEGATYDGTDLDAGGDVLENFESEFSQIVPTTETTEEFKTTLSMKTYGSIKYQISRRNALNFVAFNNHAFDNFEPRYSLGYQRTMYKTTFGVLASTGGQDGDINIGANMIVKLGPLQLYAATDSLSAVFGKPEEASGGAVRFGLNFVFGYKKHVNKLKAANAPAAN